MEHVNDLTFSGKGISSGVWERTSCPASDILSMASVEGWCDGTESESELRLLARLPDRSVSCTRLLHGQRRKVSWKMPILEIILFMAVAATTAICFSTTSSGVGNRRPAVAEHGHVGTSATYDRLRFQQ